MGNTVWFTTGSTVTAIVQSAGQYWNGTAWVTTPQENAAVQGDTIGLVSNFSYPVAGLTPPLTGGTIDVTYVSGGNVIDQTSLSAVAELIDAKLNDSKVVRLAEGCCS